MRKPDDILAGRRRIWKSKDILRRLYFRWYGIISEALRPGDTLELGGGSGSLKEFLPDVVCSDIIYVPWLDAVLDAHKLPFKDESLDNIVLFDVLHHLFKPTNFFFEAARALKPKGRIVMMEPYISWASFLIYRFLHTEGMVWQIDPFKMAGSGKGKNAFHGNQAIPTLLFEKHREPFIKSFSRLKIIQEERMDFLIYPLSGGFHNPTLCPLFLWSAFEFIERLLRPLNRYMAFRLFMVMEKE